MVARPTGSPRHECLHGGDLRLARDPLPGACRRSQGKGTAQSAERPAGAYRSRLRAWDRSPLAVEGGRRKSRSPPLGFPQEPLIKRRCAVLALRMWEARSSRLAVKRVHRGHAPRRFRKAVGIPGRGIGSFPVLLMVTRRLMIISHAVVAGVRSGRGSQAKTHGNADLVEVTRELLFAEKGSSIEGCGHERLPPGRIRVPV